MSIVIPGDDEDDDDDDDDDDDQTSYTKLLKAFTIGLPTKEPANESETPVMMSTKKPHVKKLATETSVMMTTEKPAKESETPVMSTKESIMSTKEPVKKSVTPVMMTTKEFAKESETSVMMSTKEPANESVNDPIQDFRWNKVQAKEKPRKNSRDFVPNHSGVVTFDLDESRNEYHHKLKEKAREFASDLIGDGEDIMQITLGYKILTPHITYNCRNKTLGTIHDQLIRTDKFLDPTYVNDSTFHSASHRTFKTEFLDVLKTKLGDNHGLHVRFDKDFNDPCIFHINFFKRREQDYTDGYSYGKTKYIQKR